MTASIALAAGDEVDWSRNELMCRIIDVGYSVGMGNSGADIWTPRGVVFPYDMKINMYNSAMVQTVYKSTILCSYCFVSM